MFRFSYYAQQESADCGPTCLKMICKYYGKSFSLKTLRDKCYINRNGVTLLGISDAGESIGLNTLGITLTVEQIVNEAPLPCIVHWKQDHFAVVYKTSKWLNKTYIHVADPARGLIKYRAEEFENGWISTKRHGESKGHCLIIEPTVDFFNNNDETRKKRTFKVFFLYARLYRSLIIQLILGFVLTSVFSLIVPFLTQSIVDYGINFKNPSFLLVILTAQFALVIGTASVGFIRGWIMLQLSTRINVSLVTTFLTKLMQLPIAFFNSKMTGDLVQRIADNNRIQTFLTSTAITIFFSVINFLVFSVVIAIYDMKVFFTFIIGSICYVFWINAFLKYRRELDYRKFAQQANNQNNVIQLINGMPDIKLYSSEKQKRWEWEKIQAQLFNLSAKSLIVGQYQTAGAVIINGAKNFLITYLTAKAVINGEMTLGMMISTQYIIGQLNGPLESLTDFVQSYQDAKISAERLVEIEEIPSENSNINAEITTLPEDRTIYIKNVVFQYNGPRSPIVLDQVSLNIEAKKVTAIVGSSGSGKTTLLKLILGHFEQTAGEVLIGDIPLHSVHTSIWRKHIGTVMQDGFLFTDTIANNIALGETVIDEQKLLKAVELANIKEFIESLPSKYNTIIGNQGDGVSHGQRQRILIARAIYKDPDYIFFDEATNALDANNEKIIINHLNKFFEGKTVVVVAHRLSTVRNAHNIIVLENGKIVEQGAHRDLINAKSHYYNLVKNS